MNPMQTSAWDQAAIALKQNAAKLPAGYQGKVRQIIGETLWEPLQRTTRHRFGKHVRANLEHYGLVFVGKAGTIAVYKKSAV
ncbi:hypothetical protein SAMN03159355_00044 [Pseudomonas sp. NFPP10]|nr:MULTISPECIES: hypothetical protein [Pseudomonas]BCQ61787.1 hypothetical protein PBOI14_35370 [Pseudomonas sp. Boi14]MBP5098832.1 hypothetical protein [Pseudomonas protegens]MBP5119708.1 hypothetical protein [Pseudomonas protegens]MBP5122881.1 hypothetical protein [Pseudomonas protegens]POA85885.1 hypothetical protein C1883_21430 [Pseudomonas protegens]